jgi:hypothetical protein
VSPILQLQRTLGNRRVAELIQTKRLTPEGRIIDGAMERIQPKLTVGASDDQYEQEADHVARQVMSMPDTALTSAGSIQRAGIPQEKPEEDKDKLLQPSPLGSLGAAITPLAPQPRRQPEEEEPEKGAALRRSLQRQAEMDEDQEQPIQALQAKATASLSESFEAGEEVESQLNRSKGGGNPLPEAVRSFMEPRFGMDFSQVRAHTGADAIHMNRDVGARAFTHGADIYYGAGHSPEDLALTAHELTHVVQQTGGAPLQAERKAQTEQSGFSPGPRSSLQRACSACEAEKKEKDISSGEIGAINRSSGDSSASMIQRDKIPHGALTWEDFKAKPPKSKKYDAATYSFFEDPELGVLIPGNEPVDTGEPCRAKGKDQTRFTVDITIDPAQVKVSSFMDQEKSWRRAWTTDEPARQTKCGKEWSPKCEKGFDKQFSKIKKAVSKEKTRCQKELDEKKMKKNAKKQCKPLEDECKSALKGGDASFSMEFDGAEITASTAKECTSVVLAHCMAETLKERTFSVSVDGETATATSKAGCKTEFAPELEKLLKDQATWEITVADETTIIKTREDCRKQLVDDCATDFLETSSATLLQHEQAHFDLTEAMAKKAEADLKDLIGTFPSEAEGCGEKAAAANAKKLLSSELKKLKKSYAANKKLLKKKQTQYDKETKHGTVEKKQAAWEEKINEGF